MFDTFDAWFSEICFPGAISGEVEVDCPHCGTTLTVAVDDPTGSQTYRCAERKTAFRVNWGG